MMEVAVLKWIDISAWPLRRYSIKIRPSTPLGIVIGIAAVMIIPLLFMVLKYIYVELDTVFTADWIQVTGRWIAISSV